MSNVISYTTEKYNTEERKQHILWLAPCCFFIAKM